MSQRNNLKSDNNNNSEDELESLNEEDEDNDLFMNKKELVHIENDTSINVDKSFDDDHSKTSTIKRGGLIINNISAINEQFSKDIDLSDKKIVDQNFFSNQIKVELGEYIDMENKTEQKGLNNLKQNKNGIKINPTNYFETFNNLALENKNNNSKDFQNINNNTIKKLGQFTITNFNHSYICINSVNKNIDQNKYSNEFKNEYNQLELNYINLNNQYKKLKAEYDEINNSNKSLLDLLSYWQKFYLEVKEIVLPEGKKNNDFSVNDYMDDPYRIQVIDEVKKLIIISRDKVHSNFHKISDINFSIFKQENLQNKKQKKFDDILALKRVDSFNIKYEIIKSDETNENINELKISKKFLDESDDLDFPPIRYDSEKKNIGINTDIQFSDNEKHLIFDSKMLSITKFNNEFEIRGKEFNDKIQQKIENPMIKKKISNSTVKNKNRRKEIQMITLEQMTIKAKTNYPKKFKKNTTYKFACIQTDISKDEINYLILFKNENEIIQKKLEDKINTLNEFINNSEFKNKNTNILNKNINSAKSKNNKENNSPNKNSNNNSKMFLPEMIPPENTYKIFMNCIKNFKYEEGIYQKFIAEDDIIILKNFVEKMEKYLIGSSLPILKATKKKDYIIHSRLNNMTNSKNKHKESILSGIKPKYTNINMKKRNTSDSKNYYERSNSVINNNNIIFNKYKASIMSLKDS